ncbi:HD-GYP domain-containing protein [Geothrix sp. PMB-07]|uniref:HD-GYP domain-containing protein n=1 Tax=Geothrix sp. PMB-07 TaxID=3068640 RepID=UPI002741820E|nr:HD domain-containing phosphohydrolase [Geothrix sp. PMB-07]WLT30309.1 response regulator [Geothrix sp. PMB-07]
MSEDNQVVPDQTSILIVDDLAIVRLSLQRILAKSGYRIRLAEDVRGALEILDEDTIDLILCDIQMPGASGLDLVKAIRWRIPDTSVVMVSSLEDTETAIECLQHGAFGFVLKPYQPREILVQVNGALRRRMLEIAFRDREAELAQKVWEQTIEIRDSREEIAFRLITASEHRDNETGMHVRRIGLYATEMGRLLGWDQERVDTIRAAAPLHDIGKIGVPDAVLQKPSSLTDEEWVLMKRHTTMGATILKGSTVPFIQMGARIAIGHHEKWDGSGYPKGLKGEAIPLEARITALVDVYDAVSNRRHYKPAWPEEKVVELIRQGSGSHFDPQLADLFLANLAVFRDILRANPDEAHSEDPGI